MAIVHKTRQRRAEASFLEPWQDAYLRSDGKHLTPDEYQEQTGDSWPNVYNLHRLMEGRRPPHLKHREAPWELWQDYGESYLKHFIQEHPGCRPLPWWQWEAPGAADPDMDAETFIKAINKAQTRSKWPPEKQRSFLEKHNL